MRVCLVVDNPLRDLDGLVLVAYHLASKGVEVFLVPMYEQGFDVIAIQPDFVLLNYLRANNVDLLRLYKRKGIKVGVLDTEGLALNTKDGFGEIVQRCPDIFLLDLYCFWGESQYQSVKQLKDIDNNILRLTGCPRYDYCATPWVETLDEKEHKGYILINTNFPLVNPRFSDNTESERKTMLKVGMKESVANDYIKSAKLVFEQMHSLIDQMVNKFPDKRFVLRPHPFESADVYQYLTKKGNLEIIQTGTSIEWLNSADMLIHFHCSTALEAVMLGKEPVTPVWFEFPQQFISIPHEVSIPAATQDEINKLIEMTESERKVVVSIDLRSKRRQIIKDNYYLIDGKSSERVAEAIIDTVEKKRDSHKVSPLTPRGKVINLIKRILGYRIFMVIQRFVQGKEFEAKIRSKNFSLAHVSSLLMKLEEASNGNEILAEYVKKDNVNFRMLGKGVIKIYTKKR